MTGWEWVGFAGTLASILGLFSWLGDRRARVDRHAIHTATQQTLTDLQKSSTRGHEALALGNQALADAVRHLGDIVERMDQQAEARHREVIDRLGPGREEG